MTTSSDAIAREVCESVHLLAEHGHAAFIIIERSKPLDALAATGTRLNRKLSTPVLLGTLASPLVDGVAIIRGDSLYAIGCCLPEVLTLGEVPAALQVSEDDDAIAIVVSGPQGISLAMDGSLYLAPAREPLHQLLSVALEKRRRLRVGLIERIRRWFRYYSRTVDKMPRNVYVRGTLDGRSERRLVRVLEVEIDRITFDDEARDEELDLDRRLLVGALPCEPGDMVVLHLTDDRGRWDHGGGRANGPGNAPVPLRPRPSILGPGAARDLEAFG